MRIGWRAPLACAGIIIVFMAATTTSTAPGRSDVAPLTKGDIDQRLENATVSLVALGCDLSLDGGTGVAIGGERILTNRHVVERFRTLQLVYDGTPARMLAMSHVGADTANDVAVVRPGPLGLTPLALATADPAPGAHVWVAGYARERGPDSLADGLVVTAARVVDYVPGRDVAEAGHLMRVDVAVRPGMSGGPVLDESGRLAGLVFAVQNPDRGLVIPISAIRPLLGRRLGSPAPC